MIMEVQAILQQKPNLRNGDIIDMLSKYIDNQGSPEAFKDFFDEYTENLNEIPTKSQEEQLKQAAQDALFVQNACNLSGIARSFAKITEVLWAEVNAGRLSGTGGVNTHPISKLFVNKMASLAKSDEGYFEAIEACQKLAE